MNEDLAKYTKKLGDNYVLWFEKSNSYIVISSTLQGFLETYNDSNDQDSFFQNLNKEQCLTKEESKTLYVQLTTLLKNVNIEPFSALDEELIINIPKPALSRYYSFGPNNFKINYASNNILSLIHPHLQHGCVDENKTIDTVFDIFNENEKLYLFKDNSFVGNYESKNFHFLQGKFAMEFLCTLYNNKESDWLGTFHASTICNDQEAIMIIGDSGNGKSTLSALLMANGFDLLADDFTPMLAENQHLYRFPAAISIKQGAFEMIETLYGNFEKLPTEINCSKQKNVKYLPPTTSFGASNKHFACRKIVMVKYSKDMMSELNECPSEKLLQTLIPDAWISPDANHAKTFLNWLTTVKFYELNYSNNEMAVVKFKELFELKS